MSKCCFLTIIVIVVVSILILSAIYMLRKTIEEKTIKLNEYNEENNLQALTTMPVDNDDDDEMKKDEDDEDFSCATFFKFENSPAIRICSVNRAECEYMNFCNIKICKHINNNNNVKINNDKNTTRNVTYIHMDTCIIVFITRNENVCHKEQELMREEDNNYIKSYTSKFMDLSVFKIIYDDHKQLFIDVFGKEHKIYSIPLQLHHNLIREVDTDDINTQNYTPSAPSSSQHDNQQSQRQQHHHNTTVTPIKQRIDNKGGFFYIEK